MTPTAFRASLQRLGLSQTEAARLMATEPRSVRRWGDGTHPVPGAVVALLWAWERELGALAAWRGVVGLEAA